MRTKSIAFYRGWAYFFFGATLIAFWGGLIPAMFTGNLVVTGISSTLVLVSALVSLLLGRIGFREEEQPAPKTLTPRPEDIQYTPLDPDQITFDETNWLYTRGGHGHEKQPSHRSR